MASASCLPSLHFCICPGLTTAPPPPQDASSANSARQKKVLHHRLSLHPPLRSSPNNCKNRARHLEGMSHQDVMMLFLADPRKLSLEGSQVSLFSCETKQTQCQRVLTVLVVMVVCRQVGAPDGNSCTSWSSSQPNPPAMSLQLGGENLPKVNRSGQIVLLGEGGWVYVPKENC